MVVSSIRGRNSKTRKVLKSYFESMFEENRSCLYVKNEYQREEKREREGMRKRSHIHKIHKS